MYGKNEKKKGFAYPYAVWVCRIAAERGCTMGCTQYRWCMYVLPIHRSRVASVLFFYFTRVFTPGGRVHSLARGVSALKSQVDPRVKRVPARQSLRATLACTKPDTS